MGGQVDLLRLLEPTVRPGNTPAVSRAPIAPFEQRSFESLLDEAQRQPAESANRAAEPGNVEAVQPPEAVAQPSVLQRLTGPAAVENATLRQLLDQR